MAKDEVSQPHFEANVRMKLALPNFKARLQGSKHLALKCSLYRWKGLEV